MSTRTLLPSAVDDSLTLQSVADFLRRRRLLLTVCMAGMLLAAILTCVFATRRYRAICEIQVQKEDGGSFGLESTVNGQIGTPAAGDSLDYAMTLQTDAAILRSPALALAVIESQHLEPTGDYFAPGAGGGLSSGLAAWMPWRKPVEPLHVPLAQAPGRRYLAEKIFASHLKVQPLAGTRLIDISYTDRDPERAAAVANAAASMLAVMAFQQRMTATLQGSSWLAGQVDGLRAHVEQAQAHAASLQRGTGVYGSDASRNVVLERLDSLNQTLTAAESNRILKESIDRVAAGGSPELISSLSGNSSSGSVASVNTSLSLIQGLRQQEALVRAELAEGSVRYGPAYPKISELKAQLTGIENSISAETARLGQRAHTDWQVAEREEAGARAAFEKQKQLASLQNDSVIAYQLARREADSSRDLYETIESKLKQTNLLEGLRANNISVVSAADMPPRERPSSPNIPLRLGAGLAVGLLLGLGAAAIAELTDLSICSLAQVELLLGVPLLTVVPSMDRKGWKVARRTPRAPATALSVLEQRHSVFSEGLRSLRTSLLFSNAERAPRVILVTSCLAAEGKTTLAVNLAVLLAQGGSRVLLVDADLRRPRLHTYRKAHAQMAGVEGLAMALSGPLDVAPERVFDTLPNLHLLASNDVPPFPTELLGSGRMAELMSQWRAEYDVVLLDAPPVLPVTDAALLSRLCDVTLLVARHRQTPRQALIRGIEVLQRQADRHGPIGVVLNDVAQGSGEFHRYFGYQGVAHANVGA